MKLSLYLPISIASSHSTTLLKDGKAEKVRSVRGMDVICDLSIKQAVRTEQGWAPSGGTQQKGRTGSKAGGCSPSACVAGALQGLGALHHLAQDVVDV